MKEVVDFLIKNRAGVLATDESGSPRVRPFEFQFYEEGKYYFCTSNAKKVFHQLKQNPAIEFSVTTPEMLTLRLSGNISFCNDIQKKKNIIDQNQLVRSIYKSPENPVFEVFYLEHGQAIFSDFSGNPPREFKF